MSRKSGYRFSDKDMRKRKDNKRGVSKRRTREETMLHGCRNALRALTAALLASLLGLSGASAQSGNPIKVGVGLALTGAGAAPSKVIQTALEIWRDDVNAKGGILGRQVQ